jgi:hypothetical protein
MVVKGAELKGDTHTHMLIDSVLRCITYLFSPPP